MAFRVPNIGEWFIDKSADQLFEIVALDERSHSIEIQYVDGELSEYDLDSWARLDLEQATAPEDWSACYEIPSEDRSDDIYFAQNSDPLNLIEPEIFGGTDELD